MDTPNIGMGSGPEKKAVPSPEPTTPEIPEEEQPRPPTPEIQVEPIPVPPPKEIIPGPFRQEEIILETPGANRISQGKGDNLILEDVEYRPLNTVDQAARLQEEINTSSES